MVPCVWFWLQSFFSILAFFDRASGSWRLRFRLIYALDRDDLTCTHALLLRGLPSIRKILFLISRNHFLCTGNVRKDSMHVVMQGWTTRLIFAFDGERRRSPSQLPVRSNGTLTKNNRERLFIRNHRIARSSFRRSRFKLWVPRSLFPLWWCFTRIISMILMVREIWNCFRSVHQS